MFDLKVLFEKDVTDDIFGDFSIKENVFLSLIHAGHIRLFHDLYLDEFMLLVRFRFRCGIIPMTC